MADGEVAHCLEPVSGPVAEIERPSHCVLERIAAARDVAEMPMGRRTDHGDCDARIAASNIATDLAEPVEQSSVLEQGNLDRLRKPAAIIAVRQGVEQGGVV